MESVIVLFKGYNLKTVLVDSTRPNGEKHKI